MTQKEFEKLVEEGLAQIPARFHVLMDNVVVVVEEEARAEQRGAVGIRRDEILLGLYEGVPRTARGIHYGSVIPDKITIFKKPIETLGKTAKGISELVRDTVWHEVAHHFGMDDTAIKKSERKRGQK